MARTGRRGRSRNRRDDLRDYWRKPVRESTPLDYRWRVLVYRGNEPRAANRLVDVTGAVTGIDWQDQTIRTATVTLTEPSRVSPDLRIVEGQEVRVLYAVGRPGQADARPRMRTLMRLRITEVQKSISGGTVTIQAADALEWAKRSEYDWSYKKGTGRSRHKRPNGWLCHQIAADAARRAGIPIGSLSKGVHPIKNLTTRRASPLEVIRRAYEKERDETGNKYVIRMVDGRLYVTRLRRSRQLALLGGETISAELTRRLQQDFASVFTVRATVKRDGREEKVKMRVKARPKTMRRFGRVHKFYNLEEPVDSRAAARRRAQRELYKRLEPEREVSVTVRGDTRLGVGDAVTVLLPVETGTQGKSRKLRGLAYVTDASHSVAPGSYETSLTLGFEDPFVDKEGDKIRAKRCRAARRNGRKRPKFCRPDRDPYAPTPRRGRNRGDAR